ncbi:transcriptional regulator, TetR family [Ruegeria halocynthiae]|uniref:Transcriptional regulator, TetR family n=1 Tax=Ruegeria halocynthiae TaxID=985054 RepID=A0A1H3E3W7_9RHOB|nr:TetR/AcrR family transcriptional regulator [Ruegeria halocynthiae]SDX72619.1 transcriptional regulator, TetR family [Ruegeria halocynthiae]
MPRPSLKDQRSHEILDAYLTCVARFGLEGATQERIAEEAGVKRPLLRHYLGNKDEMIAALAEHTLNGFSASLDELHQALPSKATPSDLVDALFAENGGTDTRLMLAYQALVTTVTDRPELRQDLMDSLEEFYDVVESILRRAAPSALDVRIRAVTQGISAIFVSMDALSPLNPPEAWRAELKLAASLLASVLEAKS